MPKTYSQTYLYKQYSEYDKKLFEFVMKADRIDTKSKAFEDVVYDVKRRKISDALNKILVSNNVVLGTIPGKGLPKAFRVFVAKDVKEDKTKTKVFIDVTECIKYNNGVYECIHIEWLISYLINAMTSYIYAMAETKITNNSNLVRTGGEAFVDCFSYIMDRIYKISTVRTLKKRVEYAAALYWQINIIGKDFSKNFDSIKANAMKISDCDARDTQIVDIMIDDTAFIDIEHFVDTLKRMFKFNDLSVSILLDKWIQAFGTGTIFALEYFPAFSMMMTNTYVGGYLDQQLTIEKVTGQNMVKFTKEILQIGAMVC